MADINFGLLLQKEDTPLAGTYTTLGALVDLGLPEILTEAVETTNHSSAGWRQKIPSGLKELAEFDITVDFTSALFASIYSDINLKVIANYRIVFSDTLLTMWDFAAFPKGIKQDSANAQSPDQLKFTVTFVPSGAPDFTASAAAGDWFDNVTSLYLNCGGALALASTAEFQLVVFAIKSGSVYQLATADLTDLTFASTVEADATVTAGGLIEGVTTGASLVTVVLTTDASIETAVQVTLAT